MISKMKGIFPSYEEQQKIASFLSSVDDKIFQLEKKKTLLETYKRGIMQKIFSQELRFKDENGQEFPVWEEHLLSEKIELKHGYQFRTNDFTKEGLAVIKISNVIGTKLNLENVSFIDKSRYDEFKNFEIHEGDVLMSLTGNIGRVLQVNALPFRVIQNYRVGNFKPIDNKISNTFISYLLSSDQVLGRFTKLSNQSAQANFGKQDMDKIKFRLPVIKEQQKIASFLSSIDNKIEITSSQLEKTREFKKGLLQQMFV